MRRRLIVGRVCTVAALLAAAVVIPGPRAATAATTTTTRPRVTCSDPEILPDLGYGAAASAQNSQGTIVGFVGRADGSLHAAVWQRGVLQPSFDAGFVRSTTSDVNDGGLVLGQGLRPGGVRVGWIWNGQVLTPLPLPVRMALVQVRRMNQRGDVLGTVQNQEGQQSAVRWTAPRYRPQILPAVPGDVGSFGHGINNQGTAAGASDLPDGPHYPVLWDRRRRINILPALGGPAEAWVINSAGQVAGYGWTSNDSSDPANEQHALFWDSHHRVHDLGELSGANNTNSLGISESGWVVGYSLNVDINTDEVITSYGWVWPHAGHLVQLPTPVGQQSIAHDVIENGTVVGAVGRDLDIPETRLAVWRCRP